MPPTQSESKSIPSRIHLDENLQSRLLGKFTQHPQIVEVVWPLPRFIGQPVQPASDSILSQRLYLLAGGYAVFLEAVLQGAEADPKLLGGYATITLIAGHGLQDHLLFHFL
jgi:hypothetical protein